MLRTRSALLCSFLAAGIGAGAWAANLPALSRRTGMDEGDVGLVLLCFAAGAILAMVQAPRLIRRMGAGRCANAAGALFAIGIAAVGLVTQMLGAALVAAVCGMAFGTLDVSMNKEAAHLEGKAGRPVMSFFHAMFSAGTLVAALGYAWLAHGGTAVPAILGLAGGTILASAIASFGLAPPDALGGTADPTRRPGPRVAGRPPGRRVLILGGLAFLTFFAEGAIMDWGAIYLVRVIGETESTGALGYGIFAAMMTLGRLMGDRANRSLGPVRLFQLSAALVSAALAAALLSTSVPVILAALGLCGLGMANVIPVVFSAAGRFGTADNGRAMSRVLTMGYSGILVGPALIGFLAEALSLRFSLAMVTAALGLLVFCGRFVRS